MKTKETYKTYLNSEHWSNLRQDAWYHYGYRCFFHKHRTMYVDIHHVNYRNWYDCTIKDVMPLCRECHNRAHSDETWLNATKKALDTYWSQKCENNKKKKKKNPRPQSELSRKQRHNQKKKQKKKQTIKRTVGVIQADKAHYVILNKETIKPLLNGGVSLGKDNAQWFGLTYPLPKGWMKTLYGKRVLKSEYLSRVKI